MVCPFLGGDHGDFGSVHSSNCSRVKLNQQRAEKPRQAVDFLLSTSIYLILSEIESKNFKRDFLFKNDLKNPKKPIRAVSTSS